MTVQPTTNIPHQETLFSLVSFRMVKPQIERVSAADIAQRLRDESKLASLQELASQPTPERTHGYKLRYFDGINWLGLLENISTLRHYTGFIWLEFIAEDPQQLATCRQQLTNDPFTYALFTNLEATGFNLVVRTDSTDVEQHSSYLDAFEEYLRATYKVEGLTIIPKIKPTALCFLGIDRQPYFAAGSQLFSRSTTLPEEPASPLSVAELANRLDQTAQALDQPLLNEPDPEPAQHQNPATRHELTAEDLLNRQVESIPCLLEPILQRVGLAALVGSSDVGKSAFLRQLAFAVATGQPDFLGFTINAKHQSAIYVSTEDDEYATAFLLQSLNKTQRRSPADCAGLRFIFNTHNLLDKLAKSLTRAPADLVIIDAFMDLYTGDANKSNQIRGFLHDFSQLAQKHQCLILWLHHIGKRTEDEAPSKHHAIGGQGFESKIRLLLELRRDHQDPTRRHLCITKGNYLADHYKQASYVLSFEDFLFTYTNERVPFEQLAKPKAETDLGRQKHDQIQAARAKGLNGNALADYLKMSKSYISKIEAKYGPKDAPDEPVS